MADAMIAALNLGVANQLVHRSQTVLANYTWHKSASLHVNHYQTLVQRLT
jgi:hypothetical protein